MENIEIEEKVDLLFASHEAGESKKRPKIRIGAMILAVLIVCTLVTSASLFTFYHQTSISVSTEYLLSVDGVGCEEFAADWIIPDMVGGNKFQQSHTVNLSSSFVGNKTIQFNVINDSALTTLVLLDPTDVSTNITELILEPGQGQQVFYHIELDEMAAKGTYTATITIR